MAYSIEQRVHTALKVILLGMVAISLRVGVLTIFQREERELSAKRPQEQTLYAMAERGTICDRFNIPLAINRTKYNAAICYLPIRQKIPLKRYVADERGKKVVEPTRKKYVRQLAELLEHELQLDADRTEDLIYAKAALYQNLPYVLLENISPEQFYRLRALEREWPGLVALRQSTRDYPFDSIGCSILGYLGPLPKQQYDLLFEEVQTLNHYIAEHDLGLMPPLPEKYSSPDEARERWHTLQQQGYGLNDLTGRLGIEKSYEEHLRGSRGRKRFLSTAQKQFLRSLPGNTPGIPGKRVVLSISKELQQYAEELLILSEMTRKSRFTPLNTSKRISTPLYDAEPWIKGGTIIALDPHSGEILAFANSPRFNPNDFVQKDKTSERLHWIEADEHIGTVWDEQQPLTRERFSESRGLYEEQRTLTWSYFLDRIIYKESPLRRTLETITTLGHACQVQCAVDSLLSYVAPCDIYWLFNALYTESEGHLPYGSSPPIAIEETIQETLEKNREAITPLLGALEPWFSQVKDNYDKVLLVDLCRLAIDPSTVEEGPPTLYCEKIATVKTLGGELSAAATTIEREAKRLFRKTIFKEWRKAHERSFLKAKRSEEKTLHLWQRPYLDYLDSEESEQFSLLWKRERTPLLLYLASGGRFIKEDSQLLGLLFDHPETLDHWLTLSQLSQLQAHLQAFDEAECSSFLRALRSWKMLSRPLLGRYRSLRHSGEQQLQLERDLAAAFYPKNGFGFMRPMGYRSAVPPGSIFKVVTAYAALSEQTKESPEPLTEQASINPMTIVDRPHISHGKPYVGLDLQGTPIPQYYKGGRLPGSLSKLIGKIDLKRALETSSNPYFALLAAEKLRSPESLLEQAEEFGYGSPTGIDLPGEAAGRLPDDLSCNQDGLYAMTIGQHTLEATALQTATMLAALVNGGHLLKPKVTSLLIQETPISQKTALLYWPPEYPYRQQLENIGIHFPLFTEPCAHSPLKTITKLPTTIRKQLPLPETLLTPIFEGMKGCFRQTTSLPAPALLPRDIRTAPAAFRNCAMGKTGTAESLDTFTLDHAHGVYINNYTWFGGVFFSPPGPQLTAISKPPPQTPELVVVVLLRCGEYGRETVPLAAAVAQKWRQIKQKQ